MDNKEVINIIPSKDISFRTRSLLSQILSRLELSNQDRLDLEKYITFGGGETLDYVKDNLENFIQWKDKVLNIIKDAPEEFDTLIEIFNYIEQHIQDAPFKKGDFENSAVLKGGNNKVTNANEVALGEYNESNNDTRFSIGIGTSDTDRKNALEVKQNGDIYIKGVEKPIQIKLTELENKVDKEEGKGLSEENYTADEKNKLAGLQNYDDSGIKKDLAKKADKSEIPTKLSQLEQDIEIGGEVDLSDYPTREEVSETYLPREEFDERIEGYATYDSVQKLSENVTELSAEVSGLSEGIALRNVGAEDTDESVEEPDLPTPTPSNEWKCVYDGRLEIGERFITATTFADGTPLVAKELICQVLIDKVSHSNMQGYVVINSTQNKTKSFYGVLSTEMADASRIPCLSQIRLKTSPFTYMVAEVSDALIGKAAQGAPVKAVIGNTGMPQIYENIVMVQFDNNAAVASSAPLIKIYAR